MAAEAAEVSEASEAPDEANEADPSGEHEGAAPEPPALDAWALLERVGSGDADTAGRTAVVDLGNPDGPSRTCTYAELWGRCSTAARFFAAAPSAPVQVRSHIPSPLTPLPNPAP